MADSVVDALVFDLLEWLSTRERSYEEVMDAWRTSCPKLLWGSDPLPLALTGEVSASCLHDRRWTSYPDIEATPLPPTRRFDGEYVLLAQLANHA